MVPLRSSKAVVPVYNPIASTLFGEANTLHYYALKTALDSLEQRGIERVAFSMSILCLSTSSQEPCSTVRTYTWESSNRFHSILSYPTHTAQRGKAEFGPQTTL